MQTVSSVQNPWVRYLRALRDAKSRAESGCFLVEGAKLCREAIRDAQVPLLLVDEKKADIFSDLLCRAEKTILAPEHVVAAACDAKTPQGIVAAVRFPPPLALESAKSALLALDGVQDPGNVGTMLRTAEAAGFSGALLSPTCADAFAPKTVRASMGSIFRLPLWRGSLLAGLEILKAQGTFVLASALNGKPFAEIAPTVAMPFVLIIGSEGAGISEAVAAIAQAKVSLPMRGHSESLNAAVAAGVLMYGLMPDETVQDP